MLFRVCRFLMQRIAIMSNTLFLVNLAAQILLAQKILLQNCVENQEGD